ncbi:MAG: HIT domain-containing protein [Pirellulales bacterium]
MPELRKDPITGRWVIIAENRAGRPDEFSASGEAAAGGSCPFCEGNEQQTPGEVFAWREPHSEPNGPGWRVRVVPNQFPALQPEGDAGRSSAGLYETMGGVGVHELVIESPHHLHSTTDLSVENVREVLDAYRLRLIALKRDPRLVYGMIFKNVGPAAGASLFHTHSQLIVTPVLPILVEEEMLGAARYHGEHGRCVYCAMIEEELAAKARMVHETATSVAFCPFAGRHPHETWILPNSHASHFEDITPDILADVAAALHDVLGQIERSLDRPAYNYIIHTAPFNAPPLGHYHWHIEIIPRRTRIAGFEWGTGFYINATPPEVAAAKMRE